MRKGLAEQKEVTQNVNLEREDRSAESCMVLSS